MDQEKLKTIKYSPATGEKLEKVSLALGRSKRLLLVQMTDYFFRNKKDPTDLNDELLKSTLIKSHKTYVSFIKSQEELLLIPIKEAADKMIANQKDIVKFFNEQVLGANKAILKNQQAAQTKLTESDKLLHQVAAQLEGKAQLKARFLQILGGYIRAREELGSFKGREKEELAESVRKEVQNL